MRGVSLVYVLRLTYGVSGEGDFIGTIVFIAAAVVKANREMEKITVSGEHRRYAHDTCSARSVLFLLGTENIRNR